MADSTNVTIASTTDNAPSAPQAPKQPSRRVVEDKRRPEECLPDDEAITKAMSILPKNYNFEIKKCIARIRQYGARRIALQLPEGLLMFACMIADILSAFGNSPPPSPPPPSPTSSTTTILSSSLQQQPPPPPPPPVECVVLGDVTYGACCVDDLGAKAIGCDMLIHYGHSCLVPIDMTAPGVRMLYVFVDIAFDASHLLETMRAHFTRGTRLAILGTIQFAPTMYQVKTTLMETETTEEEEGGARGNGNESGGAYFPNIQIPQAKPLSPGEVLGCTSPRLDAMALDALVFIADGRFHLESVMIHNPTIPAYRYDPYAKQMTLESYDIDAMHAQRRDAVAKGMAAKKFGVILGTLGRQGNPGIVARLEAKLKAAGKEYFILLLSEITPQRLAKFGDAVEAWIQVACPRLSVDWGAGFPTVPLLSAYEAEVALGTAPAWDKVYPMDYYARGGGSWTNYYKEPTGAGGKKGR